jgi:hypothetical protein
MNADNHARAVAVFIDSINEDLADLRVGRTLRSSAPCGDNRKYQTQERRFRTRSHGRQLIMRQTMTQRTWEAVPRSRRRED